MNDSRWFAAWVVVGCALALGVVSFALGPLVFVPAALVGALMVRKPNARRGAYGALVGVGVLLLFVAYLNREGPGTTCWQHGSTSGCGQHLNPLPWLFLGLGFVVGGFVAHRLRPH
ncbi:MAG: hypothetical protein JWO17_1742 [Actinomycetia bacterium]|nr:hypothetical protein [Actinomycetes bacterium]